MAELPLKANIRSSKCQDFELLTHHLDFHLFWKKYIDNLNFIYKTRGTFTYKKDEHTFPDTKTKLVVLVKK